MNEPDRFVYHFGTCCLDGPRQQVLRDGVDVKLRPKEFDTLLYMVQNRMEMITIDELRIKVWGEETFVSDNDIRTHVSRVRKALDPQRRSLYIDTVKGRKGYRFKAELKRSTPEGRIVPFDGKRSSGSTPEIRLITSIAELIAENIAITREAEAFLLTTGSRSRDASYLEAIETALRDRPRLMHYRVLFGPPHHTALADHLRRLLVLRNPQNRDYGLQTLHLGCYENATHGEPERFICANEHRVLIVSPSFTGLGHYDTAVVLSGPDPVDGMLRFVRELYAASKRVETPDAIDRLGLVQRVAAGL